MELTKLVSEVSNLNCCYVTLPCKSPYTTFNMYFQSSGGIHASISNQLIEIWPTGGAGNLKQSLFELMACNKLILRIIGSLQGRVDQILRLLGLFGLYNHSSASKVFEVNPLFLGGLHLIF